MLDKQLIETIKNELVMLSLFKKVDIIESSSQMVVYMYGSKFFSVKLEKNKYITNYGYNMAPALNTSDVELVKKQILTWIKKETLKN